MRIFRRAAPARIASPVPSKPRVPGSGTVDVPLQPPPMTLLSKVTAPFLAKALPKPMVAPVVERQRSRQLSSAGKKIYAGRENQSTQVRTRERRSGRQAHGRVVRRGQISLSHLRGRVSCVDRSSGDEAGGEA